MENQNPPQIRLFLATPSDSTSMLTEEVKNTLLKAGMEIVQVSNDSDELDFVEEVRSGIAQVNCSLHILGNEYGRTLEFDESVSYQKFQFQEARKRIEEGRDEFKMFIWYPPDTLLSIKEDNQAQFIDEVRTSILNNMIFTNADSSIRLVNDIRSMMTFDEKVKFDIKEAEVFIVFNELDESEADEIIDMLSDIIDPIEKLTIVQDSDMDYSEYCIQQGGVSKLVIIYFKNTADWALPFTQKVWKSAGGASSDTSIVLIGTDDPESNVGKKFNAPKVVSLIVAGELIALEIKVQYDKVLEALSN